MESVTAAASLRALSRGAFTMATAAQVTAQAPQALRMTKALLRQGRDATFDKILEMTAAMQALAHLTEDHAEGVSAVLEKRAARFEGR